MGGPCAIPCGQKGAVHSGAFRFYGLLRDGQILAGMSLLVSQLAHLVASSTPAKRGGKVEGYATRLSCIHDVLCHVWCSVPSYWEIEAGLISSRW